VTPDARAKFDALRARLKQQQTEKARVKLAKTEVSKTAHNLKLRHRFITSGRLAQLTGELAHDQAHLARLRDDLNWFTIAVVVNGQYQTCACCGHKAEATAGLYVRQQHRHFSSAYRLLTITEIPDGYPIETHYEGVTLQRCIKCAGPSRVDDLLASCEHPGLNIHSQRSLF